jgi:hypothetical protein
VVSGLISRAGALTGISTVVELGRSALELPRTLERLSRSLVTIDRLAELDESLRRLSTFEPSLARIGESLPSLAESTSTLPELTCHAAALPELVPRVENLEQMVQQIIVYMGALQATVEELTTAAADLQRSVGPIGRIAGLLPGSKARAALAMGEEAGEG